jgi:hypothetical protein
MILRKRNTMRRREGREVYSLEEIGVEYILPKISSMLYDLMLTLCFTDPYNDRLFNRCSLRSISSHKFEEGIAIGSKSRIHTRDSEGCVHSLAQRKEFRAFLWSKAGFWDTY